jgi:hypothetical protein
LEYVGLNRKRILRLVLNGVKMWAGFKWLRIGPLVGSCEYGNENKGSIKGGEFLCLLKDTVS